MQWVALLNIPLIRGAYNKINRKKSKKSSSFTPCNVPFDVWLQVFKNLEVERRVHRAPWYYAKSILQPTLFAATLVSKSWCEAARVVLYRDVLVTSVRDLSTLSIALCKREDLRPYVRSFAFLQAYGRSPDACLDPCSPAIETYLKSVHRLCPNLRFESIKSQSPTTKYCTEYLSVFANYDSLFKQVWSRNRTMLTRLDIEPLDDWSHGFFRLGSEFSFPVLDHLVIRHYAFTTDYPLDWPNMPLLRYLCLYDCDVVEQEMLTFVLVPL